MTKIKFAFFGTDEFAVAVLAELKQKDYLPDLVITTPDQPKGRKLILTPPPVKIWAKENNIKFLQPENLSILDLEVFDIFIVASYGKIIKQEILDLPEFGTLNIHPSLLPQYRGPTPIQTAILNGDKESGVSIMLLDEQVDHGPIIAQEKTKIINKNYLDLRQDLAKLGAQMLAKIIPDWIAGKITAQEQNHEQATFTKKTNKSDGEVKLDGKNAELNYRKFLAYAPWPGIYFFDKDKQRIKITGAKLENNIFVIKKVIPEGKSEMTWEDWQRGQH